MADGEGGLLTEGLPVRMPPGDEKAKQEATLDQLRDNILARGLGVPSDQVGRLKKVLIEEGPDKLPGLVKQAKTVGLPLK